MKLKQKIVIGLTVLGLGAGVVAAVSPTTYAAPSCAGVNTAIISCSQKGGDSAKDSGVWGLLLLALNILTAGVGIVAVGGIVYGSIIYSTAGDSAEKTKKAIGIFVNVAIGVIAYVLMYVVLNFLVPGGIFS